MSKRVEANLALTRKGIELWNVEGVAASAEQMWAPDIVLYDAPEVPDAGVFRGSEAVVAHLNDMLGALGTFRMDLLSLEGRGEYVLSSLSLMVEGSSSGAAATTPLFQLSRFRSGRVAELRSYLDEDQARREYDRVSAPGE